MIPALPILSKNYYEEFILVTRSALSGVPKASVVFCTVLGIYIYIVIIISIDRVDLSIELKWISPKIPIEDLKQICFCFLKAHTNARFVVNVLLLRQKSVISAYSGIHTEQVNEK